MKQPGFFLSIIIIIFLLFPLAGMGQSLLGRPISLEVNRQRFDQVLEIISNKGNFYFSYNSSIIRRDSLVSISAYNRPVAQVLDQLFGEGFEFRESGNYIIIRRTPVRITLVTNKAVTKDRLYTVSGYVLSDLTGMQISNASVYEKRLLASALTNEEGYFRLKLKNKTRRAELTVSKEFYEDTTVVIDPGYNQQVTITLLPEQGNVITIRPEDYFVPDSLRVRVETREGPVEYTYVRTDTNRVEGTELGKFLLSSRQKIQSLNLKKFFTDRPFQVSLIPGLSTHGKLSGQVVNNFSLNIFGGYSGGVNGIELGGLFNIDKKDVRYVQVAGLLNIVGGKMTGLQVAGLSNTVLNPVHGFQLAGINNMARGHMDGLQLAGVYNHVSGTMKGTQFAGVANYALDKASGTQLASVANFSNRGIDGTQISAIFNYAKKLNGVQIGLINVCDSSDGYSIGLINIVMKGYHKLAFSTNETLTANAAFKTGNKKLYSILLGGMNIDENEKAYSFGYGLGKEWTMGKTFYLNPELTSQYLYLGSWDYLNI
ncbi:MAG TPA: STN and carboxypeptidase regulatory-like domain-containing protein, partial [Flavisolibacter sp.]